eukprot:TRINITY_DN2965_c0_g1_i1.p1 TRINITY_DN2965_c0_g1~~TRINITY_DN2965_c0_g1_i1.p1  ORF type:complete len:904 (+),score=218.90 TRINITY_DN2965_c0_g1_i1:79-2712(+)
MQYNFVPPVPPAFWHPEDAAFWPQPAEFNAPHDMRDLAAYEQYERQRGEQPGRSWLSLAPKAMVVSTALLACGTLAAVLRSQGAAPYLAGAGGRNAGLQLPAAAPGSVRHLFESSHMRELVVENLGVAEVDRPKAREAVAEGFRQFTRYVHMHHPVYAETYQSQVLTDAQHRALLHGMKMQRDERVPRLGKAIGQAIRDAISEAPDAADAKMGVIARVAPHVGELLKLRSEMPRELREALDKSAGPSRNWDVVLHPGHMRLIQEVNRLRKVGLSQLRAQQGEQAAAAPGHAGAEASTDVAARLLQTLQIQGPTTAPVGDIFAGAQNAFNQFIGWGGNQQAPTAQQAAANKQVFDPFASMHEAFAQMTGQQPAAGTTAAAGTPPQNSLHHAVAQSAAQFHQIANGMLNVQPNTNGNTAVINNNANTAVINNANTAVIDHSQALQNQMNQHFDAFHNAFQQGNALFNNHTQVLNDWMNGGRDAANDAASQGGQVLPDGTAAAQNATQGVHGQLYDHWQQQQQAAHEAAMAMYNQTHQAVVQPWQDMHNYNQAYHQHVQNQLPNVMNQMNLMNLMSCVQQNNSAVNPADVSLNSMAQQAESMFMTCPMAYTDGAMKAIGSLFYGQEMSNFNTTDLATRNGEPWQPPAVFGITSQGEGAMMHGGMCFPGDSQVVTHRGLAVAIEELRQGQHVLTGSGSLNEPAAYERILGFLHVVNKGGEAKQQGFVEVRHEGGVFRASANHLVFVVDSAGVRHAKAAAALEAGDELIFMGPNGPGRSSRVFSTKLSTGSDAYAPLTASGTLIVDGVHASVYANGYGSNVPHSAFHAFFFSVRLYYMIDSVVGLSVMPSTPVGSLQVETKHPYVAFAQSLFEKAGFLHPER